mgnify:CR=1 FL=1
MQGNVLRILSLNFHNHGRAAMPKYHVKLESGRDLILEHPGNEYDIAYEAYEEACLHDDYLVDVELLPDV